VHHISLRGISPHNLHNSIDQSFYIKPPFQLRLRLHAFVTTISHKLVPEPMAHTPNPHPSPNSGQSQPALPKLVIVVGAHPAAEVNDRPTAAYLASQLHAILIEQWLEISLNPADLEPTAVLTCTDLWYINDATLRPLPTIAVGPPEHNACTAYLADKLPSVHVVDNVLLVQAEISFEAALVACWGVNQAATRRAVDVFLAKLGEEFVRQALPQTDADEFAG